MAQPHYITCYNVTRQSVVATRVQKADTYLKRLFGLLPRTSLDNDEGLWIVPCKDIHSIGMRFVFDAVFLDESLCVVHLIERMKPLRLSPMIWKAKSVLELNGGVIEAAGITLGDQLEMRDG